MIYITVTSERTDFCGLTSQIVATSCGSSLVAIEGSSRYR
jgi:hypothetical protein